MDGWWFPRSAEELEAAVDAGTVTEGYFLDFKEFSTRGSGKPSGPGPTVAKAAASLAVDGGVLILGVSEDKPKSRFECKPVSLTGLRDQVDQVIANRVTPGLRVTVTELDRGDGTGYLAVLVPASTRAPHMVDGRFYGRNESTDRPLPAHEVHALWLRHLDRRDSAIQMVSHEVEREPAPEEMRTTARLFVVAQPVSADPRLLLDAVENRDLLRWIQQLTAHPLYSYHL